MRTRSLTLALHCSVKTELMLQYNKAQYYLDNIGMVLE